MKPSARSLEMAREWLIPGNALGLDTPTLIKRIERLALLLDAARVEGCKAGLDAAAECVYAEHAKLGGRWSLDSAYLGQAEAAIRALSPDEIVRGIE